MGVGEHVTLAADGSLVRAEVIEEHPGADLSHRAVRQDPADVERSDRGGASGNTERHGDCEECTGCTSTTSNVPLRPFTSIERGSPIERLDAAEQAELSIGDPVLTGLSSFEVSAPPKVDLAGRPERLRDVLASVLTDRLQAACEARRDTLEKLRGLYRMKREQGFDRDGDGDPDRPRVLEGFVDDGTSFGPETVVDG